MAWVTLTITDIQQKLSSAELTAVNTLVLVAGQVSPVTEVIAGVISEIRGRLRNRTPLETGETIPESWKQNAIAVIRGRLCTRLPVKSLSDPRREKEYDDAMEAFRQLGPIMPETPVVVDTTEAGAPAPQFNTTERVFTRDTMDGL